MIIFLWIVSLIVLVSIIVKVFHDWFSTGKMLFKRKIIATILVFISFMIFLTTQLYIANPDINLKDETVNVTNISDVYKSNVDATGTEDDSIYYITKEGDTKLYEIVVNKVSNGNGNYIITRKYSNGEIRNELIITDENVIKNLPKFSK